MPDVARPIGSTVRGRRDSAPGTLSLNDAVAVAVLSHPLMGQQAAKVSGAIADKAFARGYGRPSIELFGGSGHGTTGKYDNDPRLFSAPSLLGAKRSDIGLTFKQLIFDFGANQAEVSRNGAIVDAERLRLADQAEDIALRTIQSYLTLLEQREMIGLIDKTIRQQKDLAELVKLNQQNGNGTRADIDHIQTKIIEIEALRSDIDTAYQTAADEFRRLTSLEPGQIRRPQSLASLIPKTQQLAIEAARTSNPALLASARTSESIDLQLQGMRAQSRPRVELQGDALVKHYVGGAKAASQGVVDMRAMLMVSYKLTDGGMMAAQTDRIRANHTANEFRRLDERETIELNLRRLYQSISANRTKRAAARRGWQTSRSVNELYVDQFKAGKRTVFEILDSNMTVFAMQRNMVSGEYEEMRATYGVLRHLGRLARSIAGL